MGYTLDLRPYADADLDRATVDEWDPAQYRAFFTRDGQQYGLPKYHGALALYYNKDLFDERNLDYPDETWDHDDYLAAMQRLSHHHPGDDRGNVPLDPGERRALSCLRRPGCAAACSTSRGSVSRSTSTAGAVIL